MKAPIQKHTHATPSPPLGRSRHRGTRPPSESHGHPSRHGHRAGRVSFVQLHRRHAAAPCHAEDSSGSTDRTEAVDGGASSMVPPLGQPPSLPFSPWAASATHILMLRTVASSTITRSESSLPISSVLIPRKDGSVVDVTISLPISSVLIPRKDGSVVDVTIS